MCQRNPDGIHDGVGNSCCDVMAAGIELRGHSRLDSLEQVVAEAQETGGESYVARRFEQRGRRSGNQGRPQNGLGIVLGQFIAERPSDHPIHDRRHTRSRHRKKVRGLQFDHPSQEEKSGSKDPVIPAATKTIGSSTLAPLER